MGAYLALQLNRAGHTIAQILSRNTEGARLAAEVGASRIDTVGALNPEAACYILAVPDNALGDVAAALPAFISDKVLIHCAGALPAELLEPFSPHAAVLWPLYAIRKHRLPETDIPLFIEGRTSEALEQVGELAHSLSARVVAADASKRRQLHLAAVFSNNFVNHLLAITQELTSGWEIPPDWLEPIIVQTLESWQRQSAAEDQTGPARRNDSRTMAAHLDLLRDHPLWEQLYRNISESIRVLYATNSK